MSYRDLRRFCLVFFALVGTCEVFGQSYSDLNWYFGNNPQSIRFIRPNFEADTIRIPNALGNGASAVGSDGVSGAVMFYTDGFTVYDINHDVMPNGTGLNGNNGVNQSVVVSANPAVAGQFFIFTNNGTLARTVVDMNLNGNAPGFPAPPLGEVGAVKNDPTDLPATPRSQGTIIISNDTLNAFWLISHETGTINYDITEIDKDGNISNTSTPIPGAPTNVANFSYNAATGQIAVSPQDGGVDVAILNIDITDGILSLASTVPGTAGLGLGIYDTEWSMDGRFLYISGNFDAAGDSLIQADLNAAPIELNTMLTQNVDRSFGLQIAPDSSIYHLYQAPGGQFRLGRINDPDSLGALALYAPIPLGAQSYQGRQFPSFLPVFDPMLMVDFTFAGTCANAPTFFFPNIKPDADSVRWAFGDGNGSMQLSPFNTYGMEGPFDITLIAYVNGDSAFTTRQINILPFDLQISGVPMQDTLCVEEFGTARAEYTAMATGMDAAGAVFQWGHEPLPGATTTLDSAGNYFVVATAANGCAVSATLDAVEYGAIDMRSFVWYFGENAGIDFNPLVDPDNPGPPVAIPFGNPAIFNGGNQMVAPEGCSVYGDDNGQPIFYSNGLDIYDRLGDLIATGIGGDTSATQSVFIIPFPEDATLYYVFLTQSIYDRDGANEYDTRYVIFDLKQRNGLGDLVRNPATNDVLVSDLFCNSTERVTGNDNWVIIHEYGNNNFRAYPITANGIGLPTISNIGMDHPTSSETAGRGYMKLSNGNRLGVALSISNNENFIEIFDFDNATGAVSNPLSLDLSDNIAGLVPQTGQVYGLEFSPPPERFVFTTLRNSAGGTKIFHWTIDTTTVAGNVTDMDTIRRSRTLVAEEFGENLGAMQIGPDGTIYIAHDGSTFLATITNPNAIPGSPTQDPNFSLFGFDLRARGGTSRSTLGLPNFDNQFAVNPPVSSIVAGSGCEGEPLTFSINNPQSREDYRWNILDENGLTLSNPSAVIPNTGIGDTFTFTITEAGTYTARVDIITPCDLNLVDVIPTITPVQFQINALPVYDIINVMDVTTACGLANGSFDIDLTGLTGDFSYIVSGPVPTTPTTVTAPGIVPVRNLSAGAYTVTLTNTATGCDTEITQTINDPAPYTLSTTTVDALCDGSGGMITVTLDGAPGFDVQYTLQNQANMAVVTTGSSSVSPFSIPSNAGTFILNVTDVNGAGCLVSESDIIIGTPPAADLTVPAEVVVCDATEARIPFTTNALSIDVSGPAATTFEGNEIVVTIPGIYTIQGIGDDVTLCNSPTFAINVIFNNSTPNPLPARFTICPDDGVVVADRAAIPNPPPGFIMANWFDASGTPITGDVNGLFEFSAARDTLFVLNFTEITGELINPFGCPTPVEIEIVEDCRARITAPSAFTPNDDGLNDNFIIFPFLVSQDDFQIFLYNRWGELIFQSSDLNFRWNGGYDNDPGRPVQNGTYAYKVQFKSNIDATAEIQEQRGGITLIR